MKQILMQSGVVVAAILLVVIAGYNVLDYQRRQAGGTTQTVNPPSFDPLPPMWDETWATEGRLDENAKKAIEAHFNSAKLEFFESTANEHHRVRIAYRRFPVLHEKGAIVISSGRTESMLIYQELIQNLNERGYSVYIHDHRGQGLSDRLLDEPQKSYVDQFNYYVADLKTFYNRVVEPNRAVRTHPRLFLLAHSMGGGIASLYLERYPGDFDAAALVTPMHAPKMPSWAASGARVLSLFFPEHYALGQQGYIARDFVDLDADLTHSRTRFEWIKQIYAAAAADAKLRNAIDPRLGGPTHQWLNAANIAAASAVKYSSNISIPVLILQASDDTAVSNKEQRDFCNKVRQCHGFVIPKAFHAIFNEADTYRVPAMTKILEFFEHPQKVA